jgi:uncharacterized protein YicC (UPF0701 family)
LQVSDARKLVLKLVGTANKLHGGDLISFSESGTANRLSASFRAPLLTAVKSYLSSAIGDCNLNIFEIDSKMEILSEALRVRVAPYFEEYGIAVPRMFVTSIPLPEDDERIIKEIALFADRCDVSEEMTRLESHLNQFEKICDKHEPVGRTLDFLCQEIFRELNTTGSKANDAELAQLVVTAKTELEKIREQVQNIE